MGSQPFNNMATSQQQTTNPFRQSMMTHQTGMSGPSFTPSPPITSPVTRQNTNPFAKSISAQPTQAFSPQTEQFQQQQQSPPVISPIQSMPTGTNPFARNLPQANPQQQQQPMPSGGGLMPQPTGNTNPFRQSAFVNTTTGSGWQNNQQPIGGGLDQLDTVPVFPRPAQQPAWQQ